MFSSIETSRRCALALLVTACVGVHTNAVRAEESQPSRPPGASIVPKPQPLEPRPFTLEDRYLDAARRADLETVKLCLKKGTDLNAKDGFRRSALLLAVRDGRDLELVEFLRGKGLAVDERDVRGITPLGYAAGNGQLDLVKYLIGQGAAADDKDGQGQTPLFHATLAGHKEVVALFLDAGADANTQDRFGDTPLMGACAKGFEEVARLLVEKGADIALADQEGRTARDRAASGAAYCKGLGNEIAPTD